MTLLEEVKNYLDITWNDEGTDKRVDGIISRAGAILSDYAGETLVLDETQSSEKQLFLDLCRYIRDNAYEDFKVNFAAELIELRAKYAVKAVEEDAEVSEV